jgi:hypothetical protein
MFELAYPVPLSFFGSTLLDIFVVHFGLYFVVIDLISHVLFCYLLPNFRSHLRLLVSLSKARRCPCLAAIESGCPTEELWFSFGSPSSNWSALDRSPTYEQGFPRDQISDRLRITVFCLGP